MSSESRDDAIREAKRYVREVVQNDWSFEFSAKPGAPPPKYPANPEPTEVLEWRVREYDSSGSELEPPFSPIGSPGTDAFDASSPQSAGSRSRRRKRRRQMEEEMSWNEGLRTWVERRDAWSGALSREQVRTWEQKQQPVSTVDSDGDKDNSAATTSDTDAQSIPASTTSRPFAIPATGESSNLASRTEALNIADNQATLSQAQQPQDQSSDVQPPVPVDDASRPELTTDAIPEIPDLPQPLSSAAAVPTADPPSTTTTTPSTPSLEDPFHDPLIPVVPSLIATSNPIRASITPAMYPSIYSKVVIQGLTPTVPINLADMTKAMVQGWKADGQWPPKPQNLVLTDNATVRPSNASATKHPDTPAIPASAPGDKDRPSSPESKRKSGIASTVRKVLHFSGFQHHPFHRRGSSSQNFSHPEDPAGAGEGSAAAGNNEQAHK
ncbi:DUF4050 domain-containing protein [Aspergillus mulundensis]|uniref:Gag1-like clamp domain-containing protein n=1 Tax=Aspergillus mulundensis TaxID=1810919 RepID=A0A3D8SX63_9EURO|nr:Uncharacterized protein DSM5745_02143 [Aspergillus mulundensis]RDW90368.1 Uncharacterized protein DSM5745_02143 [Aspergillus mulundensis]